MMRPDTSNPPSGFVRCFVYGTLRSGQSNYWLLEQLAAQCIGPAHTCEPMSLWLDPVSDIPFLTSEPRTTVRGELYFIPQGALPVLDEFEEHPLVYHRSEISVFHDDAPIQAFAYLYSLTTASFQLIESGDFALR